MRAGVASQSEQRLPRTWRWWCSDDGELVERTWAAVRDGSLPWTALDDEEIRAGKIRAWRTGTLDRNYGSKCPPDLARALIQEHMRRVDERLRAGLDGNIGVIRDVADGTVFGATAADQLRAAIYLMERVVGKVPDKVELTATIKPWETLVEGIIVDAEVDEVEPEGAPAGELPPGPGTTA